MRAGLGGGLATWLPSVVRYGNVAATGQPEQGCVLAEGLQEWIRKRKRKKKKNAHR